MPCGLLDIFFFKQNKELRLPNLKGSFSKASVSGFLYLKVMQCRDLRQGIWFLYVCVCSSFFLILIDRIYRLDY